MSESSIENELDHLKGKVVALQCALGATMAAICGINKEARGAFVEALEDCSVTALASDPSFSSIVAHSLSNCLDEMRQTFLDSAPNA